MRPLNIVDEPPKSRREQAQERFEQAWREDPEQFDPLKNVMGKKRIDSIQHLIKQISFDTVVDLGAGYARASEHLKNLLAVDVASQPLQRLAEKGIRTQQDYVPRTRLDDENFDLVLALDLIAYLPADEFRMFFSELARIVKPHGTVICSTSIDIDSTDALERFVTLAETELMIEQWMFSYDYLYIKSLGLLHAPERYVAASQDEIVKQKELNKRRGIKKLWFSLNSCVFFSLFWGPIEYMLRPLVKMIQNPYMLNGLAILSRLLWDQRAISHVIIIGKRKPLVSTTDEKEKPIERLTKKRVWE